MSLFKHMNIYSNRVCNPYIADKERFLAANFYACTIHSLFPVRGQGIWKYALRLSSDLQNFMTVVEDLREMDTLRQYIMGRAMGNVVGTLAGLAERQKKDRVAPPSLREDFNSASTDFSRTISTYIRLEPLMNRALGVAENFYESSGVRNCAVALFETLRLHGRSSLDQPLDEKAAEEYSDRLLEISINAENKLLQRRSVRASAASYGLTLETR